MSLEEFEIVLDGSSQGTYAPGDTLCGRVLLAFTNLKKALDQYQSLALILTGSCRTSWSEDVGTRELVENSEDEEYLNFEAEIQLEQLLQLEKTEFGFDYELSIGLPSSYSGPYGSISYSIKAILKGLHRSETIVRDFQIVGRLDLNEFREASLPVEINVKQYLLFEEGHLGMEVSLPKSGFVPGEVLRVQSKFFNGGNQPVSVSAFIVKETINSANQRKVSETEILVTIEGPSIQPQQTELWIGMLNIPQFAIYALQNCHLIQILYRLVIEMEIPTPNVNLEGIVPILFGNVPLKAGETVSPETRKNVEPLPTIPKTKTPGTSKTRHFRPRQKRPRTTCLVFRPDRPRLKLPVPRPETWRTPHIVTAEILQPTTESLDLSEQIEKTLELAGNQLSPETGIDKLKFPRDYIRKRENGKGNEKSIVVAEPPPKPKRIMEKSVPDGIMNSDEVEGSTSKGNCAVQQLDTLPYPRETADNFPLPDFAFNIIVDGEKQKPAAWNVTRNTLSLKRPKMAAGNVLPNPTVGWSADPGTTISDSQS